MKIICPDDLYEADFSLQVVNAMRQYWRQTKHFSCLGAPKKSNMLLYLDGVSARYHFSDGTEVLAPAGSLVYTPLGSEYRVRFYDFQNDNANTVGINFFLTDETGKDFVLDRKILVFKNVPAHEQVRRLWLCDKAPRPCPSQRKAALYEIFSLIWEEKRQLPHRFRCIEKGIEKLEQEDTSLSVAELAALCHVSPVYFRTLFKEYSGLSPAAYRTRSRIEKAKTLLTYGELGIAEIAEHLHFTDASYFCKQFKALVGMTPLEYRGKG